MRALVLLPTRELADQVAQQVELYAKYTNLRSAVVFGGIDMKPQTLELKKGVEVLVATPGRLLDHIEAKNAVLNQVEYVVLDEADRMLDIGFLPDLQRILIVPAQAAHHAAVLGHLLARDQAPGRQLPAEPGHHRGGAAERNGLHRRAALLQREPTTTSAARSSRSSASAASRRPSSSSTASWAAPAWRVRSSAKACKTTALHGDKSQDERLKALAAFKAGEVDLLVCTDVAARGLDIKDVPAVFNFDIPFNAEDYVHRIGRTGRAGASGLAVSFASGGNDARLVADIEKLIKKKIELEPVEFEEDRPRGRINDGRRHWREEGEAGDARDVLDQPRERARARRSPPRRWPSAPRTVGAARSVLRASPTKRGEPEAAPAWEAAAKAARPRAASPATSRPSARSPRCSRAPSRADPGV